MKVQNIYFKILLIAAIAALSIIPLKTLQHLVSDRQELKTTVEQEVSGTWGFPQNIYGPILIVPYYKEFKDSTNQELINYKTKYYAYFLPENLEITTELNPQIRYREIFEVVVYEMHCNFKGSFSKPTTSTFGTGKNYYLWDEAFLTIGIPDLRGIKKEINCDWNGTKYAFSPGENGSSLFTSGIHLMMPYKDHDSVPALMNFSFSLDLNGSKSCSFIPVGKENKIRIHSKWANPSFYGAFLPSKRTINDDSFDALWEVTYFGRSYPQQWNNEATNTLTYKIKESSLGVELKDPIDFYRKVYRSVAYGILFVILTFVAFFLIEIIGKFKIHIISYTLVAFALCIFYLLFLSLSEQLGFLTAYLIASAAVILLITGYVFSLVPQKSKALIIFFFITMLYVYLYVLLQIQDIALLLGAIGLFIILAFVMYVTRKIDWDNINYSKKETQEIND